MIGIACPLILVRRRTAETEMCSDYSHGKKPRKKEGIKKQQSRKTAKVQIGKQAVPKMFCTKGGDTRNVQKRNIRMKHCRIINPGIRWRRPAHCPLHDDGH